MVTVEAATALVFGDCGALATVDARAAGARVEAALMEAAVVMVEAVTVTVEAATATVDGDWLGGGGDEGGRDGGGSATQAVVRVVTVGRVATEAGQLHSWCSLRRYGYLASIED